MASFTLKEISQYPVITLVGRVNVGKSTLFNRLIEEKKALESPIPGTTRDVNYGFCDWRGNRFVVVDTGGFVEKPKDELEKDVFRLSIASIKKADLILFLVDVKDGPNPDDRTFLSFIRKHAKAPIVYVANKADRASLIQETYNQEWLKLGLGKPVPVSAVSGLGVGDLLDIIGPLMNVKSRQDDSKAPVKIAIVGRTNVGKSSIVNKILGEERVIVSPQAHTTREPQDTRIEMDGNSFLLIDTVGIRKKTKVKSYIEREGVKRSIENIEKADVVVLVLESTVTPSKQESKLADLAVKAGSGILIVVNKWDLVEEKESKSAKTYEDYFRQELSFIKWAPILFTSALIGQRTSKILERTQEIQQEREKRVPQEELTSFLNVALAHQKPIWILGRKKPNVYGFTQEGTCPPTFALHVKDATTIQYAYLRYLENRLRDQYGFAGTPIRVYTLQEEKKEV